MAIHGVPQVISMLVTMSESIEEERELRLELLALRDEVIGIRAEDAESRFRHRLLRLEYQALAQQFEDQKLLLRENMTRAYEAEKRVLELQAELDKARGKADAIISSMQASRSWKLARVISSPLRVIRRALRS